MDKNEMSYTPLVRKYISTVDGMAHQSAIEIIINLEKKLEAAKQETEIQKAKADKHYELGTEYFDLYTKAVKGQLKEKNGG